MPKLNHGDEITLVVVTTLDVLDEAFDEVVFDTDLDEVPFDEPLDDAPTQRWAR